jgi:hypothetical protein
MPIADKKAIKRIVEALGEFGLDLSGLEDCQDLDEFAHFVEIAARDYGPIGPDDGEKERVRMSLRGARGIASFARGLCSKINSRGRKKPKKRKRVRMSLPTNRPMTEAKSSALAAGFIRNVYGDGGDGGGADSFLRNCGYDIPHN